MIYIFWSSASSSLSESSTIITAGTSTDDPFNEPLEAFEILSSETPYMKQQYDKSFNQLKDCRVKHSEKDESRVANI